MKTGTDNDAENAVKDIVLNYPIEWEHLACQEVLKRFRLAWNSNMNLFQQLSKENNDIGISSSRIPLELFDGKENYPHNILLRIINDQLICWEPYLCRCMAYITGPPEDISTRETFFKKHLRRFYWEGCMDILETDVLKNSVLAKQHQLTGIPLLTCLVGRVLHALLTTFKHYHLIDLVKLTGAQESIEELRIKRIQKTHDGYVRDYTPLFKLGESRNDYIIEVFEKQYFNALLKFTKKTIDRCLVQGIARTQTGKGDRRKDELFGDVQIYENFGFRKIQARHNLIIKCGNKTEVFANQLLPRWFGDVLKATVKRDFTRIGTYFKESRKKDDEVSIAAWGLFQGALACPEVGGGDVTPYLRMGIKYALGEALEEVSIGEHQRAKGRKEDWQEIKQTLKFDNTPKAILKEDMDRFGGGSLDEPVRSDDSGSREVMTKQDIQLLSLKEKRVKTRAEKRGDDIETSEQESQEERLFKQESLDRLRQEDPRFWKILQQKLMGDNISPADQDYYERKKKKIEE